MVPTQSDLVAVARTGLRVVVTFVLVVVALGMEPSPWFAHAELEGSSELEPGASETMSFRGTMQTDDEYAGPWSISLNVEALQWADGSGAFAGQVISITGREPASGTECNVLLEADGHWLPARCDLDLSCADPASGCTADVEFQIESLQAAAIAISWSADASVGGTVACTRNPDKVERQVTLEPRE